MNKSKSADFKSELIQEIQSNDEIIEYYVYVLGNSPWDLINETESSLRKVIEGYYRLVSQNISK